MSANNGSDANEFFYLFVCALCSKTFFSSTQKPKFSNSSLIRNMQGAKKITFTGCHSGKLKLAFTSPEVISTSPKSFLTRRIDFTVLLLFEFFKKHHLPIGQVKNRIHKPDSKIHQPWAIGHYFLCTLNMVNLDVPGVLSYGDGQDRTLGTKLEYGRRAAIWR